MGGSQLRGGSHRPLPKELKTTEDAGRGATKAPWSYRWLAVAGRARQTRSSHGLLAVNCYRESFSSSAPIPILHLGGVLSYLSLRPTWHEQIYV